MVLRSNPVLVHARTGPYETDTPLLKAVLGADRAMARMLLDEGSPAFGIDGAKGRLPLYEALRGGCGNMLEVFVEHAGGINGLVDKSLSEGKLSWMLGSLTRGTMPTRLHEDLLLAALEPVGRTSWPEPNPFSCIEWPWSEAHNWNPEPEFMEKLEKATIKFPSSPDKMRDMIVGQYTPAEAWINTMACLVRSRPKKLSNQWLAQTPPRMWRQAMPSRPSARGPQPPYTDSLLALCAMNHHLPGLKMGLEAIKNIDDDWIEHNRFRLFSVACGLDNPAGYPSVSAIRLLDKMIGMKDLSAADRKRIISGLIAVDSEPLLRVRAVSMFLDGPGTLPSGTELINLTKWAARSSNHVGAMVMALSNNGMKLDRAIQGSDSMLDLLMTSHPQVAAGVSSALLSSTSNPEQNTTARPRI